MGYRRIRDELDGYERIHVNDKRRRPDAGEIKLKEEARYRGNPMEGESQ